MSEPATNRESAAEWKDQWSEVRNQLRRELGEATFNSWIRPLALDGLEDRQVVLSAPTRFMRDWVVSHFAERLREKWQRQNEEVRQLEITVAARSLASPCPAKSIGPSGIAETADDDAEGPQTGSGSAEAGTASAAGPVLDPRLTFETFVVGKSNELAYAAARRVAENASVQFNPLFLYGGVGLGKTHLMQAIAQHIGEQSPGRQVMYLSAEKFMYQFIRALRFKDTLSFKQEFRNADVLMIDDVQFIAGKNSTQEEFFHTFNALVDNQRQVVISADRSPSDLEGIDERIRSRLGWGLVADIHPTDYELRLGILQSKAEQAGVSNVPVEVLEFLARRITSNVRELEGALNRVLAYATLVGREITIDAAQEVLSDLLRANDRRVSIEEIQRTVAEYFNLRMADLLSARRARSVARPRQVAMYLAKQLTSRSLPEIGRKFGGRDHTTVMHAVKRIEELRDRDNELAEDLTNLHRSLQS